MDRTASETCLTPVKDDRALTYRLLLGARARFFLPACLIFFQSPALYPATRANGIDPIIQVFTGGLDGEGVVSSSLHVNGAPSGPSRKLPPGITPPSDLLLITPEIDYGVSSSLEASLYMPMVANLKGGFDVAGGIGRLTWVPLDVPEDGGFFAGTTWAFSGYQRQFSFSSYSLNGGFTAGYENDDWLLALNGFMNWDLSGSSRTSTPSFGPALAVKRYWGDHLGVGLEYYGDIGSVAKPDPMSQQYQSLFGVIDWDEERWSLNLGVGHGMTPTTDEWMVKMIFFVLVDEPESKSREKKGEFSNLDRPQGAMPQSPLFQATPKGGGQNGLPRSVSQPLTPINPQEEDDEE